MRKSRKQRAEQTDRETADHEQDEPQEEPEGEDAEEGDSKEWRRSRKTTRKLRSSADRELQLKRVAKEPNSVCKDLSFQDCELAILRSAVDKAEEKMAKRVVSSESIQQIIRIVEDYIRRKKLVCYGGTAINNILPEEDQFYNKELEIPDYDFYSPEALDDARELADLYYNKGYTDVEAKSGQHHGTYKVFVNYIPIADITYLPRGIFVALQKDGVRVDGITYAPPNFLRANMYLELSRPAGDTSRWEKVLKRLTVLNKHYAVTDIDCDKVQYQRPMHELADGDKEEEQIFQVVRDTLVRRGCVFFGGYAISLYAQYMPKEMQTKLQHLADFDVLANDAQATAEAVAQRLRGIGAQRVEVVRYDAVGEIVPLHYEVRVGKDSVAFLYQPIACHSYNVLSIQGQKVRIATIDTMLSFYLAFLYADKPYYNEFLDRSLCMAKMLFEVQQHNRLQQKGLLRRFSITCYGHQETIEEMRAHKAEMYKKLKNQKKDGKPSREYEEWFLSYKPDQEKKGKHPKKTSNPSPPKQPQVQQQQQNTPTEQEPIKRKRRTTRRNKRQSWWKLFSQKNKKKAQRNRRSYLQL